MAAAGPAPPLLPLLPHSRRARLVALLVAVAVATLAGWVALRLQSHFADEERAGVAVSRAGHLLAAGSGPWTAWEPWAAAGVFAVTALRLRRGAPEPPAVRGDRPMGIAEMRRALRGELEAMRWVLLALAAVALLDGARWLVYVAGSGASQVARDSLGWTGVEAAGLAAAAVLLGAAAAAFRDQLLVVGALVPGVGPEAPAAR